MINLEFAWYLFFVCVHWVLFFSCCLAQKEAKVRVCCAVSFILPPVQAILWWQLAEVPRDVGSQFNFHFIVSAYGVDGGRGKMMLHLWPTRVVSFLSKKRGLQHLLLVHGAGSLSHLPNSWLCMAGSCGSLADVAWGASGLCRSSCHHLSSSAAPGRWQQACHWEQLPPGGGKLEVEAGSSHLPMRQMQDLSDAAAIWIPACWEEEGGGRTVFSLPGHRCVTGGSWREDKWKGRISS